VADVDDVLRRLAADNRAVRRVGAPDRQTAQGVGRRVGQDVGGVDVAEVVAEAAVEVQGDGGVDHGAAAEAISKRDDVRWVPRGENSFGWAGQGTGEREPVAGGVAPIEGRVGDDAARAVGHKGRVVQHVDVCGIGKVADDVEARSARQDRLRGIDVAV